MENIKKYKNQIDEKLIEYLDYIEYDELKESMSYSIKNGGKRVRPTLLLATYEAITGSNNFDDTWSFAVALEYIHTYSLIHDDLPAMDNDDYRRGQLTSHKVFGEDVAILTGDALLNTAFEIMSEYTLKNLSVENVKAMNIIAKASGSNGMILGQMLDMKHENTPIDIKVLEKIHTNKTSELIKASILSGVVLAKNEEMFEEFGKLGDYLGLAFQIKDDILECTSTFEKLGKSTQSDAVNNKSTYVTIYGLEGAEEVYNKYTEEILRIIDKYDIKGTNLGKIIEEILYREN